MTRGITRLDIDDCYVVRDNGCWEWKMAVNLGGYGMCTQVAGERLAHRIAWALANGPIPKGMTVDHLCFNTICVNPAHLRLLSLSDNAKNQRRAFKTHCVNGHEFTPENTYQRRPTGGRMCKRCSADSTRERKRRKREERGAA